MLVDCLNQFVLFNNREQTLDTMGKGDSHLLEDVEEGEISDSASIDEISEEDYNKQVGKVSISNSNSNSSSKTRVWTMQDLYKYSVSHNYTSDLCNFAWAQAVHNKPLDEVLVMELKPPHENSNLDRSSPSSSSMSGREDDNNNGSSLSNSGKELNKVIIDVSDDKNEDVEMESEKEEGELEEGEIELDSEVVDTVEEGKSENNDLDVNETYMDVKEEELEKRVNSIREELENVTPDDADKSFPEVCSRLENSLDGLLEVFDRSFPSKDALIQLSLDAIRTVYSVFCSMNQNQKEHNRHILSSLIMRVTSQSLSLFSPERMKELEVMIPSTADGDKNKETQGSEGLNKKGSDDSNENSGRNLNFAENYILESVSNKSLDYKEYNFSSGTLKYGLSSAKGRGVLLPLLELHKDHDVESLPSPTREAPLSLPINKVLVSGGVLKPEWPTPRAVETESTIVHPYEKDALKAVSTYQQKFGRSSFILKDRLPSPTPSEECDDGDDDTSGEVSSSSTFGNSDTKNAPNLPPASISPVSHGLLSLGSNPALRSSAKSRDPRLLLANAKVGALDFNHSPLPGVKHTALKIEPLEGTVTSRKQKTVDEPVLDGPVQKRQRTGSVESVVVGDVQSVPLSGGWLEDSGTIGPPFINRINPVEKSASVPLKLENEITYSSTSTSTPNVAITSNEQFPITGASPTASLQSLLKDIAVNPAIWMNIMKMEQEKSVITAKSATPSSTNSILGAVPSINLAPPKSSVMGQRSAGILQTPQTPVTNLQDELGKIRMKPRDPRRVLHNNTVQKSGNSGSDQFKTTGAPTTSSQGIKGNFDFQNQEAQSNNTSLASQSIAPPDITRQFTSNLKNIADIMSASQAAVTPSVQIPSSQPVQVNLNRVDVKGVASESDGQPNGTGSSSEEVTVGTSRSQNSWGDMEHLFEGFDDQQKAAIQRERARRIEEQRKMFAARKLCLVLDLDHTLLNSAKFMEVDPVHDEILRKKEEQDREKPQKHLFRFPQMCMWTKLRPGIWNFLEKASKLFELHLYTMGNKLYATEMAKLLDPKGVLFDGRVISRGDDGDLSDGDEVPKSKDLDGVLGMESAVVIIDDSVRVWPHHKLNLIAVERYIYFPCSRRQFGLPGPSLLEIDHDERHEDGTLASSLAVIERIHENFFSHQSLDEVDVRNILASEQRKILAGCRIVFSRVFPVGETSPHMHPLWQTAEQFGAVCTNQIDEQVTHVVANSLGTDKVNWALWTGRFVVHPGWVEASALLYRRANEHDFAIKP